MFKSTVPRALTVFKYYIIFIVVVDSYKHGNEPTGSIKGGEFLD